MKKHRYKGRQLRHSENTGEDQFSTFDREKFKKKYLKKPHQNVSILEGKAGKSNFSHAKSLEPQNKKLNGLKKGRRRDQKKGRNLKFQTLKATVDKNQKGFAFLIFENKKVSDSFVPPREADALFHGDRVEVQLDSLGRTREIKVLEHRFKEVVGRFFLHSWTQNRSKNQQNGWVIYERKRAREEIYIPNSKLKVTQGDWVKTHLHFHETGPFRVTGEILEVYGKELPPSVDVSMVASEYGLIEEHSKLAVAEAEKFDSELSPKQWEEREDLRQLSFVTIDGETARDFDDAVFVERLKSGYVLWTAIADVSHYVKVGTHLDQEARSRSTSVYFPERAFHMLPNQLSENLCSLKPKLPRLALVAKIHFNYQADRVETQVIEAVIESKRRCTYNEIDQEWQKNLENLKWEFEPHFNLYQALRKKRIERGSLDFELPESEVLVEPTGEVKSIQNRTRLDSHRLIEEFMIAANEAVTEWMMEKKWPFVYRTHDQPSSESLEKFEAFASTLGIKMSLEGPSSPMIISDFLKRLEGHPAQSLLNMMLLRSMKQAVYSSTHGIHFGLASPAYTHFTSPIRRYPDLVVHRLLKMALHTQNQNRTLKSKTREKLEAELAEICDHCSYRERLAADAEREAIKLKQVRLMMTQLGNEFEGRIVGMVNSGIFVQLDQPFVEGMVSVESMSDDFYEFDEDHMIFKGKRKKAIYRIGDLVKIRVVRTDLDKRQIDFVIL